MARIVGTSGRDVLRGTSHGDVIIGKGGNDKLIGRGGNDKLKGGKGKDTLKGNSGNDKLIGGQGKDKLIGGSGNDKLDGGAGNDKLDAGNGDDTLNGGSGNDLLDAGPGNDVLFGGDGNDLFIGGPGADIMNGGGGSDDADYSLSPSGIEIRLDIGFAGGGDAEGDGITSIENFTGSAFGDILQGDEANNRLVGGAGQDVIRGNGGIDLLSGGPGADTFVFVSPSDSGIGAGNRDVIGDFSRLAGDKISLSLIDADPHQDGDQAFNFYDGGARFAPLVEVTHEDGNTIVTASLVPFPITDLQIELTGTINLTADDFFL